MGAKEQNPAKEVKRAGYIDIKGHQIEIRDIFNSLLIIAAFAFYTLTFFVPKFYGATEDYVGVFIFLILGVMTLVNVNPIKKLKEKDFEFIALVVLALLVGINILIVDSGYGCFFIAVNFAIIWYLSGIIRFKKWQIWLVGGMYAAMLVYWCAFVYTWMFADYSSFAMNTNTAATFTVFSVLCLFVFIDLIRENHKIFAGLLTTVAIVKCIQLSLYHRSRGAFIMFGTFLLLRFIVPKSWWSKKAFFIPLMLFATLGSLLFVAFYVWLGTTGVNFQMPFFYKNIFSGREAIWLEFWNLFKEKPITGIGTNVTITSFFEFNVHNAMYNILVIHGLPVFALNLFIMYRRLTANRVDIVKRPLALGAMAAVFSVCIESFFDVDMIWANYSLNLLFLLLVMNYGRGEKEEGEIQKENAAGLKSAPKEALNE